MCRFILESTATDVSRIGTAINKIGVKNDPSSLSELGCKRIVRVASRTPRNNAPASPMYILAGLLFQTRKPSVAPAVTVASAAIKN